MAEDKANLDSLSGILIPLGILIIVMLGTGVIWLIIPIIVLGIILISDQTVARNIRRKSSEYLYSKGTYVSGSDNVRPFRGRPIYDQRKRKDEGVAFGLLLPIGVLFVMFIITGFAWPFLIPLFVLVLLLISSFANESRKHSSVFKVIDNEDVRDIQDIADRVGLSEEEVRRQIVREKRGSGSDVWFDSETGRRTSQPETPSRGIESQRNGCPYCGFVLEPQDRYCPYCGAPIRVS